VTFGILVTPRANFMSFAFHTYQAELYPTHIRAEGSRLCLFLETEIKYPARRTGRKVGLANVIRYESGGSGAESLQGLSPSDVRLPLLRREGSASDPDLQHTYLNCVEGFGLTLFAVSAALPRPPSRLSYHQGAL
jgi:hypothetical protein